MNQTFSILVVLNAAATAPLIARPIDRAADALTFERDIRPIFRAHCFDCHGSRAEKKGKLDLRLVRFLLRGGDKGPAIVAGEPGASLLLKRLRAGEMPPGDAKVADEELRTLELWIEGGARTARPEPESVGGGVGITREDRAFWSFQPVRRPVVDRPQDPRIRTEIDALLARAAPGGTAAGPAGSATSAASLFSADADRRTLLQRLALDLTGLPPTPAEIDAFRADSSPLAYEALVDRLLASPRFGERWARHWLDVAGYADSEGYTSSDAVRPWAYKYRDWVIRAFNDDKRFDLFLLEQLAGDELAGEKDGDWTAAQIERLTATGFLRMAADGTGSGANTEAARNQVVADSLQIVGSALLGLSIGCAQCHDHRYDPIPQTDYYALRAIFEPALDWKRWRTPQARRISLYTEADRKRAGEVETEAKKIADERSTKQTQYLKAALEKELSKYEEPLRGQLDAAYGTSAPKRTAGQKALLKKHPSVNVTPGVLYQYNQKAADDLKAYDKRIAAVRAKKPVEEFLRALDEAPGHVPVTHLFHRGDHRQPQAAVEPGVPRVLVAPGAVDGTGSMATATDLGTTGRRLAFARWLTGPENPLTARVIANRVWMHLFGRGLVSTPSDFGRLGTPPTHPELLDWLAGTLRRDGWSVKRLIRRLVLSTAYRQSSYPVADRDADPSVYSRRSVRRLDAETLRDRMLAANGRLENAMFGPSIPVQEDDAGQIVVANDSRRRTIYAQARRSRPVALLRAFDAPVMETNCEKRPSSTVATQSLMLLNGEFVLKQAAHLAARSRREANDLVADEEVAVLELSEPQESLEPRHVAAAWKLAYGRAASAPELELALEFVDRQIALIRDGPAEPAFPEKRSAIDQALTNLCQMLLISNEFLYVE